MASTSRARTSPLPIPTPRPCSNTSIWRWLPGKSWRHWFDPASKSRRWPWCSPASTGRPPASSGTMMWTFVTSRWTASTDPAGWCWIPSPPCSTGRWKKTSRSDGPQSALKIFDGPFDSWNSRTKSTGCLTALKPAWTRGATDIRRARFFVFSWPARSSRARRC